MPETTPTPTVLEPFVLEIEAVASARLLIFAESFDAAHEILHERVDELVGNLAQSASLPDSEAITFDFNVRPAFGSEVAGTSHDRLNPGEFTLDVCTCADDDEEAA